MNKLVLLACCVFAVISCKKSTINNPVDTSSTILKKIATDAENYIAYEYDGTKRLTKKSNVQLHPVNGKIEYVQSYQYLQEKLVKVSAPGGFSDYNYLGNVLKSINNFKSNGESLSIAQLTYNTQNQLSEIIESVTNPHQGNPLATKIKFNYYDNGNLKAKVFFVKFESNEPYEFIDSTVYEQYDNQKNIEPEYHSGFYLPNIKFQKNNPIKIVSYFENGVVDNVNTIVHTYNNQGFPITRRITYLNGGMQPINYTFQY